VKTDQLIGAMPFVDPDEQAKRNDKLARKSNDISELHENPPE
jgi:hypothetical protein